MLSAVQQMFSIRTFTVIYIIYNNTNFDVIKSDDF